MHQKGGLIFAQLIHAGRASHEKKTGGLELWAPSAIAVRGETIRDLQNCTFPVPKAMTFEDILETKIHFEESVKLAKWCGFDGVQLHGAHGYLVDSFLRSATNLRSDCYGVDKVGRCRFALELIDIATNHFSSSRVGIKISPVSRVKDMFDSNPE